MNLHNYKKNTNPYRRSHPPSSFLARRWAPLVFGVVALLLLLAALNKRSKNGCNEIESLLFAVRQETVPRWEAPFIPNDNMGGVVLFWHLAKTGGSTIRGNFASSFPKQVDYRPLLKPSDWNRVVPQIERNLMNSHSKRILFVELHGQGAFANHEDWDKTLLTWRHLAEQYEKHFFVFTILREPLAHAISYYNFFHKSTKSSQSLNHDGEADFVHSTTISNRQCTTLLQRRHRTTSWWGEVGVTDAKTCTDVYSKLLHNLDWIGTTETLSNETLPLIHLLLSQWTNTTTLTREFQKYNVGKVQHERIRQDSLSDETLQQIRDHTCLDRALWRQVQVDYPMNHVLQHYQQQNDEK